MISNTKDPTGLYNIQDFISDNASQYFKEGCLHALATSGITWPYM